MKNKSYLQAIENIIVEKTDRANFLSNLILSEKPTSNGDKIWRVNMNAYLSHPDMMTQVPTFDDASFEGETLFINGNKSKFASKEHEAAIYKVFPNAEISWIKDTGHLLHLDKQKEFCEKIITFLEKWINDAKKSKINSFYFIHCFPLPKITKAKD